MLRASVGGAKEDGPYFFLLYARSGTQSVIFDIITLPYTLPNTTKYSHRSTKAVHFRGLHPYDLQRWFEDNECPDRRHC